MDGGANNISPYIRNYNFTLMKKCLREIGFDEKNIMVMSERDVDIYISMHEKNQEKENNNG